jgi:hypothetical protein
MTIKDKIQKLLSLSTSPNEHEASSALKMAHELLKKYNLSMKDIKDTSEDVTDLEYNKEKTLQSWKAILLQTLCNLNFCSLIIKKMMQNKISYIFQIIGKEYNIISVKIMADYIFSAIERKVIFVDPLSREFYKDGFAMGVIYQLKQELENEENALIIIEDKKNQDYIQNNFNGEIKDLTLTDETTYSVHKGFQDGKNLPLNKQVSDNENKKELDKRISYY